MKALEAEVLKAHAYEAEIGVACLTGKGECPEGKPGAMTLVEVSDKDKAARLVALKETILPRWSRSCGADCAQEWNETVGKLVGIQAPLN